LTWFDQQEEERKKRQQIIQQMLNQTKSQKSYQPDYKGAAAFFGKYEAKQNPKTTTKPKAKTDTGKKTGLLDSLMKNASQFGNGIKNEFHSDINQFKNDLKDGFDLKDAADLATMPLKYINPGGGNVLRGAVLGKNTHEDNFSADVGRNFTAGVGDVVKGVGDIMKWQGAKDPRTGVMDTWGKNLSDFGQKSLIDNYEKPYDKPFTWSSLLDPSFYSSSVARSLPFTLALLPASYLGAAAGAGAATAGLGAIAARGVTLGKAAQTIIKTAATAVGGSAVSVPFESAFEAANVYDDAIQKGASHEDADKMANDTFKGNLALLAGTQLPETALTFAHLGGFNPGLLGRTAMMAGSAGLEGVQEAGQEVISAHAKGQKADPTAMKESFAVGALMGLGSSIAGGELGKQDHGHLTPPVHPSDNPSPNDIPDPTSNQSYEEERQQAEKILGGADPKVVIRDAVRNRLPDELKSEVDFLRTSMEQQGLDQNEIEDHLDNYIADNPEGQKLFEEETQRLVERLKPEAAPTPTQADPAQNGIDEAVRQTQQAQVDPIQQADPQQAQPEQVQPQAEQQAPVQEQAHPLQARYSEVMRQYNDLLNQRNPHMLSDKPNDKKALNELSKQMKPLDKELTRLEKQMKKVGVSIPEGQVAAPQGQPQADQTQQPIVDLVQPQAPVQEQTQQPMPTAQELNAMPIDERLKYQAEQQAQQPVKQTAQEQKHPLYGQVVQHTLLTGNVSPSSIQEKFKIPYTQAVQLIDQMEANGIIESKPKEPLTQQPEQPVSTDAQGIKGMFDGIGQGIGEAAHQKTMEDVAKQGYTEFQKPESANLFRNNEQYKGWKEEKQSNGAIRFYPPAEQIQETKGSKTLEDRRKEHEAKRQEQAGEIPAGTKVKVRGGNRPSEVVGTEGERYILKGGNGKTFKAWKRDVTPLAEGETVTSIQTEEEPAPVEEPKKQSKKDIENNLRTFFNEADGGTVQEQSKEDIKKMWEQQLGGLSAKDGLDSIIGAPSEQSYTKQELDVLREMAAEEAKPTKYDKAREKLNRLDRLAQKADQYLKDNKDRMNALPLDLYAAAAIVGANKIAHGVVDFAEWSEQMIKDYGPKLRLSLRSLYVQSEDIANFSDADLDEYLDSVGLTHLEDKTPVEQSKAKEVTGSDEHKQRMEDLSNQPKAEAYAKEFKKGDKVFYADYAGNVGNATVTEVLQKQYRFQIEGRKQDSLTLFSLWNDKDRMLFATQEEAEKIAAARKKEKPKAKQDLNVVGWLEDISKGNFPEKHDDYIFQSNIVNIAFDALMKKSEFIASRGWLFNKKQDLDAFIAFTGADPRLLGEKEPVDSMPTYSTWTDANKQKFVKDGIDKLYKKLGSTPQEQADALSSAMEHYQRDMEKWFSRYYTFKDGLDLSQSRQNRDYNQHDNTEVYDKLREHEKGNIAGMYAGAFSHYQDMQNYIADLSGKERPKRKITKAEQEYEDYISGKDKVVHQAKKDEKTKQHPILDGMKILRGDTQVADMLYNNKQEAIAFLEKGKEQFKDNPEKLADIEHDIEVLQRPPVTKNLSVPPTDVPEGYQNGFKLEQFKKGEPIAFYWQERPSGEYKLTEGKVDKVVKAPNANGKKDAIQDVIVEFPGYNGQPTITTFRHGQIAERLFKPVKTEAPVKAPETPATWEGKFKAGDIITYVASAKKRRIKGRIVALDRDKGYYRIKPDDTVHKSEIIIPEDLIQPFQEQEKNDNASNTLGKNEALVTTQAGTEVQVKYEIVSMDDVIASHNVMGMINPKFPKELQPRDRSSADSEAQITEMARNLDPQRLGESRMASDGAPIIGPDGVVESGNGRTIAIMKMYSDMNRNGGYNPTEQKYNRFLKEFAKEHGLDVDVERMSRPVLVRVRQTDVNREKFVAEANESSVSSMGATETAQADAKKLKSLIHLFVPSESGDINTAANQEFIKKYINEVVPSSERREVRTKEGYLSKDGKERLERALFALAYNDNRVIAKYSEDLDDNARTVTGAMTDVAPKMAVLNGDIEAGSILPEFDLSKDVIEAFNQLVELRRKGEKIPQWIEEDKKQESLFADTKLSDAAYELLAQFDKLKSRNKIRAMLFNYVEYVMNDPRSQGEDLFGDRATKEEFLQIAIERMNGGGDLFELETKARPSETPQTGEKPGTKETSGHSQEQTKVINPLPEDPSKVDKKHFNQYVERMKTLINEFTSRIESGIMPTGNAVQGKIRDIAAGVLGRPAQEDEWRDALEVTIQQIYQTRVKDSMTLQEKIKIGQELEGYMKTSGRSIEQMDRQQFSTPIPLAEIVHSIAGVNSSDVVKEGSAGTGSLILPFKGEAKQIVPIELSPRRAAILKAIGFDVINDSTFNVTGIGYDKVVGNPPFKGQNKAGGTVELSGSAPWKGPWGDLGNRFLNWDLRGLKDGGRLTYIVSGGVIDNQQNREFRKWLKENHTVLAMVKFPSGVYDTRGTKFPTGLIVVEKGKAAGEYTPITGEFETLDSLLEALSPLTGKKPIGIVTPFHNSDGTAIEGDTFTEESMKNAIRQHIKDNKINSWERWLEKEKDITYKAKWVMPSLMGGEKGIKSFVESEIRNNQLSSLTGKTEEPAEPEFDQVDSLADNRDKEFTPKSKDPETVWKEMKRYMSGMGPFTNLTKVKHLNKMKEFAAEHGFEFTPRMQEMLDKFTEARQAEKEAPKQPKEPSKKKQQEQKKETAQSFKDEIARQKAISTVEEAETEFNRRVKTDRHANSIVRSALKENDDNENAIGYKEKTKEGIYQLAEGRISSIWQDVFDLVIANNEDEAAKFYKNAKPLIRQAFNDMWDRKGVVNYDVVSNEGNGDSGTENGNENADVRGGKSASDPTAGGQNGGEQSSGSGREGTGGTGTVHGQTDVAGPSGTVDGSTSSFAPEQATVSENVPTETSEPNRGDTSGPESKGTDASTSDGVSSDSRYVPGRVVTGVAHMGDVTEAPNMRFVELPEDLYSDEYLPHPIVVKGGKWKLSDVQIETVMAAKYNFAQGKRGILLADDTGMGKTAQQLGIAADAWHSGRTKRILVVTTKDQVATSSFIPENENLGFQLPITWISPNNAEYIKQHGKSWRDDDFNGKTKEEYKPFQVDDGVIVMSKTTFRDSQESVIKWLGETGDVTILMDESHEFANRDSGLGKANVRIYQAFKDKAQYVYSSATAAEDIEGLEHLYGLHKWDTDGFGSFKLRLTSADSKAKTGKRKTGMSGAFDKSGKSPFKREVPLTMMEQITRELKMDGQYIGRQLSMEGIAMEGLPIKLSPKEMGDWNRAVQFIGMIAGKAETYGRSKDGEQDPKARGRIISQVVGYMRRLSGYYRMKAVIADVQKQMDAGTFKRFGIIGEFKSGDDGQPANLFAAINAINTQDPVDTGDDIVYEDIPEAIEDKGYLLAILRGENPEWGDQPIPSIPSPMQLLYDAFGEDNVAIVSGDVKQGERPKVVKEFQTMKKNVIWFNSAGGTGVNMHDTIGEPIRVYTQDYPYNAKAQKQAEGRFNRTGQVTKPTYVYPYLNSSSDTKFVGTLIARYEAMGALSRGDVGKLGGDELANFDMTGEAADLAVTRLIPELDADVRAEMFGEFARDKNFESTEEGMLYDQTEIASVFSGNAPEVKKLLNALMFLDYETSSRVFNQFTEKIAEVEKELEEKGGVKDKFETYKGKEIETQVGKNGIKLRKIQTILTDSQRKSLDYELKKAQENEQAMIEEYDKTKEEVTNKLEKQVEEITKKQNDTLQEIEDAKRKAREAEMKYRGGDLSIKELEKARNKTMTLNGEYSRRKERLDETKKRLKGLKDGNTDIIDTIPDMRRAESRKTNGRLFRLGAEANIERSKDILLVDGKIATNGLLVNIRQAIREAAKRIYGEKTPASALTLELRGYTLENGERAIGAVVPKWAEGEVAKALEARMNYSGDATDATELEAFLKAGNKVTLQGGFELEYNSKSARIRINGMTIAKDRELFKKLNAKGPIVGFDPVSRAFSIDKPEALQEFVRLYPILEKKVANAKPKASENITQAGTRTAKGFKVEVNTDKHTTTGETIWVVKPIDSIPKEQWGAFAGHMKKFGGNYYGKFTKGDLRKFMGNFVFQKNPEPAFDKDPNPPLTDEELANRINRNIPSSDTQGFVHPLFRGRTRASSDRPYVFSDPTIQERIDAAEEIPKEGFKSMLKTWLRTKKNQVVREYEHLPNTAEFSPLRHELLRLEKQRGVAMEDTARNLQALLTDLNRNQYELFRNLVLTADLMEENALGHALPFSFTEDSLKEQNALMQSYLANEPKVQDALDLRKRLWAKIKSDYVKAFKDIDQDVEQKFTKENYYRHLIVEKAKEKKVNAISGKKELKTPKGQGYMKHRKGSEKDFVTDYLLAESEVMANMLFDIQVAKSVKLVDDRYNIEKQLKKEIELENNRSLLEYVKLAKKEWARTDELQAEGRDEGEIDAILKREGVALPERVKDVLAQYQANYKLRLGGQHDNLIEATMKAMKNNVGRAYGDLKKLAQNGDLWAGKDDEYQDVVDDLAAGRDNTDKNRWFDYLSELGSTSEEGVIAALTYLKNVRGQRLFQQDLIGRADFKTIQNSIPPGYDIWQPDKGNVFYMQNTLPEQVAMNLFNGFLDEITEKNFTKMLVMGGKKKGFIVKDEVKTTLENLMPISKYSDWLALSRQIKQLLLLSPTGVFKYNARNMTGDLDKVVSGNPDSLRYFATAANDLGRVFFKKGAPPKEMNEWMRRGGIQTLLQSQEFGDMKNLSIFRDKIREKEMATYAKVLNLPVKVWKGFWNATRTVTDYREAILRYASFLSYLKQIEKSGGKPKNYGASLREEINALPDKYDKAFTLSNDLLIAYDKTSVMGKKLRDTLIPFVSFTEGNIRSYIRVFKNAYHDEELANAVGRKLLSGVLIKSPKIAFNVGRMAMKVTFLTVLTALFNNLFWPDEEKELPADVRNTVHIILGRDDKGQVLYFNRLGTLQDFLGWFGLDDVQGDVASYLNGEKTLPQLLGADVIQSANKLVQSLHPIGKTIGEEIAGLKFFPDFTHPTQIQDRIQHIMGLFTFDTEYASIRDAVMGRPHKRYKTENLVAYSAEPEETNYYNVKDKAQAAAEKYLGKEKSLYLGKKSETSQYLYEIKQGLHYGDMEYAQTYLNKYIAAGGTDRGLKTSLKSMNPLDVIPTDLRQSYYNSLSDEDKANVDRAYKYYQKVLLNGVKLD
jgi:hypothetical protein